MDIDYTVGEVELSYKPKFKNIYKVVSSEDAYKYLLPTYKEDIMSSYVGNAPADTERYGVNGFFRAHVVQQTGKRLVKDRKSTRLNSSHSH